MSKKASPKEYLNALGQIDIKKVNFIEVACKLFTKNLKEGSIDVDARNDVEFHTDDNSQTLAVIDKYHFEGKVKESTLFALDMKIMVVFETKVKPDDAFFTLFEQNTLKVITYPYVREAVQDLTTKMGLTPLVLPMWRAPLKSNPEYLKPGTITEETVARGSRKGG